MQTSGFGATAAGSVNRGAARGVARGEGGVDSTVPSLWTIQDVSRYLSVPVSSLYKMTARKAVLRIPHIRIGGKVRFRQADIDRWLQLLTVSNLEVLAKMR